MGLLVLMPLAAAAEEPAAETGELVAEEPAGSAAEQIVVTARKREESLQDVPLAITALPGETLETGAAADLSDLQTRVPNLAIFAARNQSTTLTAFLRGVGQVDALWGVDPAVGLYLDDVYLARPQGALLDLYDVERIEVLRGPQGTLYGKNTIGGAIRYVTRPIAEQRAGSISFTGGSDSERDLRASLSGTIVEERLLGKIAAVALRRDGYGTNLHTGRELSDRDTLAARGALDWLVSDAVKVRFAVDSTRDAAEPKGYRRLAENPFCPAFGVSCPATTDRWDTEGGVEPRNGTDSAGGSLTVDWRIDERSSLRSIAAWRQSDSENNIDFDTTPARIADVFGTLYDEQRSEEIQYLVSGTRLSGVLGAYLFDGEAGGRVRNILLDRTFTTSEGRTLTRSAALFADGSWRASPRLRLNLGLRATRETKNGIAANAAYTDDTFRQVAVSTAAFDQRETFDSVAPKLGVDYRFGERVLGYVTATRGFKSGGFNIRAQATVFPESAEPFDDERLDLLEAGVKSVLANGSLVLNAAAFCGWYDEIQVSTFTAYDSDGDGVEDAFFGNFLNAGDADLRGLEVELAWTPSSVSWLGVSGYGSWLDASPESFLDENRDGFVDTQVITNAPELTAGLRADVDVPVRGGLLTAGFGSAFRDDALVTNEGGQYPGRPGVALLPISQHAYWLHDAWVSWLSPGERWRLALTAGNLTDEEYLTSGYNVPAVGVLLGSYGAPRTLLATLEYRPAR